jgi:hypothetical protein
LKSGKVVAMEKVAEGQDADWVEVRIDFADPHRCTTGAYEARIEAYAEVITALNSAKEMELEAVKQYRVSHLVKVE